MRIFLTCTVAAALAGCPKHENEPVIPPIEEPAPSPLPDPDPVPGPIPPL